MSEAVYDIYIYIGENKEGGMVKRISNCAINEVKNV